MTLQSLSFSYILSDQLLNLHGSGRYLNNSVSFLLIYSSFSYHFFLVRAVSGISTGKFYTVKAWELG